MAESPSNVKSSTAGAVANGLHLLSHGSKKLIADIQGCVQELKDEYADCLIPIDDDNQKLHGFFQKLEYLLQCDRKDKFSLLGNRKDYWDYFVKCLASSRHIHDGVKFVKSVTEFKTSLGRGRAFLRFCLMHHCLGDTLQQCFQNRRVTSDFYRDVSPLVAHDCTSHIIASLYELNEVNFDLCPHGYDLDVAWPTFAKRSFVPHQSWYPLWRAPSRTVSMSSLVSTTPQQQQGREGWQGSFTSKGEDEEEEGDSRQSVCRASVAEAKDLLTEKSTVQGDSELRIRLAELEAIVAEYNQKREMESNEQRKQEELQGSLRQATERAFDLDSQLEERKASFAVLEERLKSKQQTEDSLNDQLTAANYEKETMTEQLDKWKQLVSGYVEKLAVKERVNEHLERQVSALREATDALREMMRLRTSECTSLRSLVQELKAVHNSRMDASASKDEGAGQRADFERLESEKDALTAELNKLRDRICELESERPLAPPTAGERTDGDQPAVSSETGVVAVTVDEISVSSQVDDLNKELEDSRAQNRELQYRLDELRGWMLRIENAELELDELMNGNSTSEKVDECGSGGGEERSDPEGKGEDCDAESPSAPAPVSAEDFTLVAAVRRTLNRLNCLIADRREGSTSDGSVSLKVKAQEAKLSSVTMELGEARALVDQLREAFTRLQTSEAVLRYELGEKRTVVDRLRRQLESSRSQWNLIRQKHSESEQDFLSLRAEFASRLVPLTPQGSEESGCEELGADAASSTGGDDLACLPRSLASPSPDADKIVDDGERRTCVPTMDSEEVTTPVSESPSTSSNYDVSDATRQSRLRLMEEQCRLLYAQLVQSRKKSELLEWKLAHLHVKHGGGSSDATNESDELLVEESVGGATEDEEVEEENPENSDREPERNLELEDRPSFVEHAITEPLVLRADDDDDLATANDEASTEAINCDSKPGTLQLAQALPRRIVKLKREKENLARDVSRLRLAQQQSEEDAACRDDAEKSGLRLDLERARATLVEFKRRVELVMRKEREEKEARYRVAVEAKRELQIKVERLESEVCERQSKVERLEDEICRSTEDWAACRLRLEQEIHSLRLRLSSETQAKELAAKHHARHESDVALLTDKLVEHEQLVAALEEELSSIRRERHAEMEHQNAQISDLQLCLNTREEECTVLNNELKETTRCLDEERRESACLKAAAEECLAECAQLRSRLDEALTDCHELQRKIVKLIREKDRLWQRSEHLSFQQKIQASDRWLKDDEVPHCLACRAEFSLVLRKHHCRLCGRIFCFNCCNHWAMTTSSSRRVRVCNECIIRHSQIDNVTQSLENEESEDDDGNATASTSDFPYLTPQSPCEDSAISGSPSSASNETTMNDPVNDPRDLASSVAEEAYEKQTEAEPINNPSPVITAAVTPSSPPPSTSVDGRHNHHGENSTGGGFGLGRLFSSWSSQSPKSVVCVPDDDEFCVIGDEEIMKSLSSSSPYWPLAAENSDPSVHLFPVRTIDEIITEFERGLPCEVWVDAGKTCAVPILIEKRNTLTWAFTTEPKSIVFTLVFHYETQPEADLPNSDKEASGGRVQLKEQSVCEAQILVPRTHCDSHLHPVHGKLVAKKPGVYTLYFDNGFSRFTAKKVKFILRVNKDERLAEEQVRAASSPVTSSANANQEDK